MHFSFCKTRLSVNVFLYCQLSIYDWKKKMTTPFDSSIKEILFVKIDVSIQPCWFRSQIQEIFKMCKAHGQGN